MRPKCGAWLHNAVCEGKCQTRSFSQSCGPAVSFNTYNRGCRLQGHSHVLSLPMGHHSHSFDHEMSQIRNKFSWKLKQPRNQWYIFGFISFLICYECSCRSSGLLIPTVAHTLHWPKEIQTPPLVQGLQSCCIISPIWIWSSTSGSQIFHFWLTSAEEWETFCWSQSSAGTDTRVLNTPGVWCVARSSSALQASWDTGEPVKGQIQPCPVGDTSSCLFLHWGKVLS